MKIVITLFVALAIGCTSQPKSEEEEPAQEQGQRALPELVSASGSANCHLLGEDNNPGYEPDLALWAQTPDSIFLGTISEVNAISPAVLVRGDEMTVIDPQDCEGWLRRSVEFTFVDVETIVGSPLPDSFTIQVPWTTLDVLGAYWSDEHGGLRSRNEPVYFPGSRIGSGVFQREGQPELTWGRRLQQFEVVDGKVYLGEISIWAYLQCAPHPFSTGIPEHFDGAPLSVFLSEVQAASVQNLTQDQLDRDKRHWVVPFRFAPDSDYRFLTECFPPVEHEVLDPNTENNRADGDGEDDDD